MENQIAGGFDWGYWGIGVFIIYVYMYIIFFFRESRLENVMTNDKSSSKTLRGL